jgi:hypothetical protein
MWIHRPELLRARALGFSLGNTDGPGGIFRGALAIAVLSLRVCRVRKPSHSGHYAHARMRGPGADLCIR